MVAVPIVIPHTSLPLRRVGNMLLRWNLLGPELPFPEGRHTPIGNPRAIAWSAVHWLALYPHNLSRSDSSRGDGGEDDSRLLSGLCRSTHGDSSIGCESEASTNDVSTVGCSSGTGSGSSVATDNDSSRPLVDVLPAYLSSTQALELLRVHTVHAMGGTRPWMDEHIGTTLAWYGSLAEQLEQLLQMHVVHID